MSISAGGDHSVAIVNGRVIAWGNNRDGQLDVPNVDNVVQVSAGVAHTLALTSEGKIWAWGSNRFSQCDVPKVDEPFVQVSAGDDHSVGLLKSGRVVAWGRNQHGQCDVPNYCAFTKVSAGAVQTLLLTQQGHLLSRGNHKLQGVPSGEYTDISAGLLHSLAIRDGKVVGWGQNNFGQCDIVSEQKIIQISANADYSLALAENGHVLATGENVLNKCVVPSLLEGLRFVEISAGVHHALGRVSNGAIVAWGSNICGQCDVPELYGSN